MISAPIKTYSVLQVFFAALCITCIGLTPKSISAQTLEVSGGLERKLYGRLIVTDHEKPELLPASNYIKYGYKAAKFMEDVSLFVVGDEQGEYFFKTRRPSDRERFPIIFTVKSGPTEEVKLFWVNLTENSAHVDHVQNLASTVENYHEQLGKIGDRGEIFEKLLADLTFKINELEANNSVDGSISSTAVPIKRNVEATDVEHSNVTATKNVNSDNKIHNHNAAAMRANQPIVPSVSSITDVANRMEFLLSNQELLNANMMLRMLSFLCGGLSLILLYFALVAKLSRKPNDQSDAISQELQKRDVFESTILLRERNLYDRVAQIAQQTFANQQQVIAPLHDPSQVMRDMLEEYLRPSQVEQISTNENADAATSHNQQSSHRNDVPAQSISRAKKKNVDSALNNNQQSQSNLNEKQRNNQATRENMEAVQSTAIPEDEIKKLQVATVYYNMGDLSMAKSLLKELEQSSFDEIKNDAKSLLREIDR